MPRPRHEVPQVAVGQSKIAGHRRVLVVPVVGIEEIQLTRTISDLRETFDFLCRQKGIDLNWELPKDPMPIRSDTVRVKEVVSNLLQNAVKYTDQGSITVRVGDDPSSDRVVVEVADTGMGISEQNLTSIFEPFM